MTATETDRQDLHAAASGSWGQKAGDTLMELLPPIGWGDVARASDVLALRTEVREFKADMREFKSTIIHSMWAMGAMTFTGFVGLFSVIITKL